MPSCGALQGLDKAMRQRKYGGSSEALKRQRLQQPKTAGCPRRPRQRLGKSLSTGSPGRIMATSPAKAILCAHTGQDWQAELPRLNSGRGISRLQRAANATDAPASSCGGGDVLCTACVKAEAGCSFPAAARVATAMSARALSQTRTRGEAEFGGLSGVHFDCKRLQMGSRDGSRWQ